MSTLQLFYYKTKTKLKAKKLYWMLHQQPKTTKACTEMDRLITYCIHLPVQPGRDTKTVDPIISYHCSHRFVWKSYLHISYQLPNLFSVHKLRHKMQSEAQPDKMIVVDVATEHRKDDKVLCISIL